MTAGELIALADRCEAATGPDRELDLAIAKTLSLPVKEKINRSRTCLIAPHNAPAYWKPTGTISFKASAYTASLDAAMTLVPEGWFTRLAAEDRHSHSWRWDLRGGYGIEAGSRAATPALALTATCLRARAALASSDLASKSEERDDG